MKVVFGCDHAGYRLKEELIAWLRESGYEVLDKGTFSEETVDYPDFIAPAAEAVARGLWRPRRNSTRAALGDMAKA